MSDLVNIPRTLFTETLASAAATVKNKTSDRAQFGQLDHIDGERLLETLAETVTKLRAAARPGPGGCACLATVTAERDEALAALRVCLAGIEDLTVCRLPVPDALKRAADAARAAIAKAEGGGK